MFSSFSDSALSTFRWYVSWAAAGGSLLGVICTVLTIFSTLETSRRSKAKSDETDETIRGLDSTLLSTQAELDSTRLALAATHSLAVKSDAAIRPRVITDKQKYDLHAALKDVPRAPFAIQLESAAEDADSFGQAIAVAMSEAGFPFVGKDNIQTIGGPPLNGVIVGSFPDDMESVPRIVFALNACGIPARVGNGSHRRPDTILITIARKAP